MTEKELKRLDYLYKYCTKARSRGQLYRERLKELQQLTVKELAKCQRKSKRKCKR